MNPTQVSTDILGDNRAESLSGVSKFGLGWIPFGEPLDTWYNHCFGFESLLEVSSMVSLNSCMSNAPSPSAIPPYVPLPVAGGFPPHWASSKPSVESQAELVDTELPWDVHDSGLGDELIQPWYLERILPTLAGDCKPGDPIYLTHRPPLPLPRSCDKPPKPPIQSPYIDSQQIKGRCAGCGKCFTDLRAHMLTKQSERPEKCPIPTCEYHIKGFARKYDRARHTLTHSRGMIVCSFCPESLPTEEKSFDDVRSFKRHLTRQHDIERRYSGIRQRGSAKVLSKKAKCQEAESRSEYSGCETGFQSSQDLYDKHDWVLGTIQREEIVL